MQILPAIAVDVICILIFAIVGRSSHQEATDLVGVAHTAWPFLAGCLLGTLVGRTWRRPYALASGVAVWLGTVIGGMTLRVLTGAGVQLSFVVVASIVLALFILGWRAGLQLIQRARAKTTEPERKPGVHLHGKTPHRVS
jgi:peptidoglycan/LPS O-acetylase OafA/YrhL